MRELQLLIILILSGICSRDCVAQNVREKENYEVEENIVDTILIGEKGKFKVDITQKRYYGDSVIFEIKLFERTGLDWVLSQRIEFRKDGITPLDPIIADFNNDNNLDLAVRSCAAARMSNVVRKLFIFNVSQKQLVLVKNSENYPNLRYNKELNCIDSWMVYAGSSTIFLKLENDSLKEFAGVGNFDGLRTIYEIDDKGKENIIRTEKISDIELYDRFSNYSPLKKCNEE